VGGWGTLLAPPLARNRRTLHTAGEGGALRILATSALLLTALDHWTTFLCLRQPVAGWQVTEANPISDWLFAVVGLVPGLLLDSAITVIAVVFLLSTSLLALSAKKLIFTFVVVWTAYAVINNLQAITTLGLSPLGSV
jgi:hypothetical protein